MFFHLEKFVCSIFVITRSGHKVHEAATTGTKIATGLMVCYIVVLVFRFLRIIHVFHDLYEIQSHLEKEKYQDQLDSKDKEIKSLRYRLQQAGMEY